jgi:hypothetical protein
MTSGFQNQDRGEGATLPKTAPKPQHGAKPAPECVRLSEKRSFQPRPGH